ncbi:uncharacterized protein KIAA1958-like [Lytechinus variegatus]|uniref:uncharacterized protein KIAA1958-like n=1 Tax=Lytechinus variegatus TaxID=7654 RepID=UPI001BB15D84|nr:uncharacterized protein KIAA1958-like [Lytechinus variegatus]
MAAPTFALLTDLELEELVSDADAKNTKRGIKFAKCRLEEFAKCASTSLEDVEKLSKDELDKFLCRFYAGLRKEDGTFYAKKTMHAIRFGVCRHFKSVRGVDISDAANFSESQKMYKAMMIKLKKEGKGYVQHKTAISDNDMAKITQSDAVDTNTPLGLQNKVFLDVMTYFGQRGRENLHLMKFDNYVLQKDEDGVRYFEHCDTLTKSRRENEDEKFGGRMYEVQGSERCPVFSLLKYITLLNPELTNFWQRPKSKIPENGPWYDKAPLGLNSLGNKMKNIAKSAGCTAHYTNHSLRATTVTILDQAGIASRDIMEVTGHRSESSLKNYVKTSKKKRKMSAQIASSLQEEEKLGQGVSGPRLTPSNRPNIGLDLSNVRSRSRPVPHTSTCPTDTGPGSCLVSSQTQSRNGTHIYRPKSRPANSNATLDAENLEIAGIDEPILSPRNN